MMNIKTFIVFLLLSLCSAAALAMPSVGEVENAISSGDYPKARSLLAEVLKEHPDSKVANQYMLEIIKLEYARTLKPSVEYKLYENKIQLIDRSIQLKKRAIELNAKAAKEAAETKERKRVGGIMLKWFLSVFIICGLGILFVVFGLPRIKRYRKMAAERKRINAWKSKAYADLLDINQIISSEKLAHGRYAELSPRKQGDVDAIEADNLDVIGCVDADDFEEILINRHIYNAKNLLRSLGWME